MNILMSLLAGLLFGIGLIVSGMTDPAKVLGFLDITRIWDPSLAFVMSGAIVTGLLIFQIAIRRGRSALGNKLFLPSASHVDKRLVIGAVSFGIGWGLSGICPGPALILLSSGSKKGMIFFTAMLLGMCLFEYFEHRSYKRNR